MTSVIRLLCLLTGLPVIFMLSLPFPQSALPLALLFAVLTILAFILGQKDNIEVNEYLHPKGFEIAAAVLLTVLTGAYVYLFRDQIMMIQSGQMGSGLRFLMIDLAGSIACFPGFLVWMQAARRILIPWLSRIPASVSSLILAVIVWFCQGGQPLYEAMDNFLLSLVTDGYYSEINQSVFVSPILSQVVKWLGNLFPSADGFMLLLEATVFVAVWVLLYFMIRQKKRPAAVLAAALILIAWNPVLNLYHANFTFVAGFAGLSGFYGLLCCVEKKLNWGAFAAAFLLLFTGCCIRIESVLLLVPFAVLAYLYILFNSSRNRLFWKKSLLVILASVLAFGSVTAAAAAFLQSPEMKEAYTYSEARSALVDFPAYNYSEQKNKFLEQGMSENDYLLARLTVYADTDLVNADYLSKMAEIAERPQGISLSTFMDSMELALSDKKVGPMFTFELVSVLLISVGYLCFCQKKGLNALYLFLAIAGSFIIMLYFASKGRLPFRLKQNILFGNWLCLLALLPLGGSGKSKKLLQAIGSFVLTALFSLAWVQLTIYIPKMTGNLLDVFSAASLRDEPWEQEKTSLWYFLDFNNYHNQLFRKYNKLPSEEFLLKNIPLGEWTYGQPYYEDFLNKAGIDNPIKALMEGTANYAGRDDMRERMLTFISEHYGLQMAPVQVGDQNGFLVSEFILVEDNENPSAEDTAVQEEAIQVDSVEPDPGQADAEYVPENEIEAETESFAETEAEPISDSEVQQLLFTPPEK